MTAPTTRRGMHFTMFFRKVVKLEDFFCHSFRMHDLKVCTVSSTVALQRRTGVQRRILTNNRLCRLGIHLVVDLRPTSVLTDRS
jgi:hypothetical protein